MPAQKGLGKGLGALFGEMAPADRPDAPNLNLPNHDLSVAGTDRDLID